MLMRRLGWAATEGGGGWGAVLDLTVRAGTEMQLGPQREAKQAHWRTFYAAASGRPAASPEAAEEVKAWLGRVWDLGWENGRKEPVFLLAYDGVATKKRLHVAGVCACGAANPGREHCFWDCPVAAAVAQAIQQQLPPPVALRREHVWLGREPGCDLVAGGIWDVVAAAAIGAMAKGRALLVKWELGPAPPAADAGPPADRRAAIAARDAVLAFWAGLQDFASLRHRPGWVAGLRAGSLFLRPEGNGLVVVGP
jgi:hypothetical protein